MKKFVLLCLLFVTAFLIGKDSFAYTGEGFEGTTFPPTGWTSQSVLGDKVWARSTAKFNTGTASAFMDYETSGGDDWLISPVNTIATGDSVSFYLLRQFTSAYPPDSMYVYISTTNTVAGFTTRLLSIRTDAISPTVWSRYSVSLNAYAGQNIYIGFRHKNTDGNGVYLDDVKIGTPPATDVGIASATPSGQQYYSATNSTVSGNVTITNNGGTSTSSVVYRTINGITYTSGTVNLTAGQSSNVNFSNVINFTSGTTYTIRDSVYTSGDAVSSNNVLSTTFTPRVAKTFAIYYFYQPNLDSMVNVINTYFPSMVGQYDTISLATYTGSLVPFKSVMALMTDTYLPADRVKLQDFLDSGTPSAKKSLAVFGEDIGYYYDPAAPGYGSVPGTTAADTIFYRQYLRARYLADIWGYGTYSFVNSNRKFKGLGSFSAVTSDTSTNVYPDLVRPVNGGSAAFIPVTESGDGDSATATSYVGTNYNMLYVTIPFFNLRTTGSASESQQGVLGVVKSWVEGNGGALPVELAAFTSSVNRNEVTLKWVTVKETNNKGFEIERKAIGSETWNKAGDVTGMGNTDQPNSYSFTDKGLQNGKYSYRLKQVDFNGNFEYHNLAGEVTVGVPNAFALSQNYPNPFNPTTKIDFALPMDSKVSLKVYDMLGKEVAVLMNNETRTAGYYTVQLNGSVLSSGIYFYTIKAEGQQNFSLTKKMVLVK